jgi:hypothetical protein
VFKYYDPAYQIYDNFILIKNANSGDAVAQHDLGLRYLAGDGFIPDTVKAFYWIEKSANQDFILANYNLGIFYINGWGTDWNPFEAFKYFLRAANQGMEQAQFNIGLIYTENLIVPRNLYTAYYWISKAAKNLFLPAKETLLELEKRGITSADTSLIIEQEKKNQEEINSNKKVSLAFIDFTADTLIQVSDSTLIDDLLREVDSTFRTKVMLDNSSNKQNMYELKTFSNHLKLLKKIANEGSPEALTILGKLYEKGIGVKKNLISASEFYIRAVRLESPRSPRFLWDLSRTKNYFEQLKEQIDLGNPGAMFVWGGLKSLGFDYQITEEDAIKFLTKASKNNHVASLTELGLCFYFGNFVKEDKQKAIKFWDDAIALDGIEARLRIEMDKIASYNYNQVNLELIKKLDDSGSILAQISLAYCYELGIGLNKNFSKAVELYRKAAYRGSRFAYNSLKRIYNTLRPAGNQFQILN